MATSLIRKKMGQTCSKTPAKSTDAQPLTKTSKATTATTASTSSAPLSPTPQVATLYKAKTGYEVFSAVNTVYGTGFIEEVREKDFVVKLTNWALAQGQSPTLYLQKESLT